MKKLSENSSSNPYIYMYEQITPVFHYVKNHFKKINLKGSEFLGFDIPSGTVINGIRHEDAMNLSFENNYFDLLVSCDVFEHVPDIDKTLTEAFRVLKQKGKLLISIPFRSGKKKTERRAFLKDGKVVHVLPELYHGNPIPGKSSLVFYDYGWDFLEFVKKSGFTDAYMLCYYSMELGYIGGGFQYLFVCEK